MENHFDPLITQIADYIFDHEIKSSLAFETARYCLIDSLGCAALALTFPACTKLLGPWVEGTTVAHGARVIGTSFELDPIKAAFDTTALIRWLDYNDTWLAQEWGHPSDNIGGLLSVMDFVSRRSAEYAYKSYTVQDLLTAMIKAYEIQGILALTHSFNEMGLDHVFLVKLASTGLITQLMGGTKEQVCDALSQVFVDGQALRTYRHAPNVGSRKSWAAGDATSRAVRLAMLTLQGESGYPTAISTKKWGFSDALFKGKTLQLSQPLGSYVIENILFKVAYPAEFHAQTAVEAAIHLHPVLKGQTEDIEKILIKTHEAAIRIIDKQGSLKNPADRDHCLQYMVAVALLEGKLEALHYEEAYAQNPLLDKLRALMHVSENKQYSLDYLDPSKRSIANTIEIYLKKGEILHQTCEYPLGHRFRREEGIPRLWEKFSKNIRSSYSLEKADKLEALMREERLSEMKVSDFIDHYLR